MAYKEEFDHFLDQIKPHIVEYLEEKGIDTSRNFRCLNPEHEDKTPSMTAAQAPWRGHTAYCFSCGRVLSIFDIYAISENKPRRGPEWVSMVVMPLAKKYGIRPPVVELTPTAQFRQDLYQLYGEVASLLRHDVSKMQDNPASYVNERCWSKDILEEMDVGCISYEELSARIDRDELKRFGLNRPDIFNEDNLVFAFRDMYGRAIRFFARRFSDEGPKWHSTACQSLLFNVWEGQGHLYGLYLLPRGTNNVLLVEGQSDVVSLRQAGVKNVVGICGVNGFSSDHADHLALRAIAEITVMYDGDIAGRESLDKLLAKDFVRSSGVKYSVIQLPDNHDPDSFLREFGKETIDHVINTRLSAFGYLLSKQDPEGDVEEISKSLVPLIASNPSEISREVMARELSQFFKEKISVGSILTDVKRSDQAILTAVLEKKKAVVGATSRQAEKNVEQAREIYRDGIKRIEEIEQDAGLAQSMRASFMARVQSNKQWEERDRGSLPQEYEFHPKRAWNLQEVLDGGSYAVGEMIVVGAVENMGKTSFVNDLAWQIASNPANKARVLVQTLDDSAEKVIRRLVCQAYGSPELTMNMVANPRKFYEKFHIENVYEMREEGYAKFLEVANDERIIVKDASDGKTVSYAETQIEHLRRKYPNDNIVYVLDNFHNVGDWDTLDMRTKFTNVSKYLNNITTVHRCTLICTAEYRKGDATKIGTNDDLAEMRALKFDANLIIHLFSDAHVKGVDNAAWVHPYKGRLYPRVIARIGKDKITDYKGDIAFDFFPGSALFYGIPYDKARQEHKQRKEQLGERGGEEEYGGDD